MAGKFSLYKLTKFHTHITFFIIHVRIKFLQDIHIGVDLSVFQKERSAKNVKVFHLLDSNSDLHFKQSSQKGNICGLG